MAQITRRLIGGRQLDLRHYELGILVISHRAFRPAFHSGPCRSDDGSPRVRARHPLKLFEETSRNDSSSSQVSRRVGSNGGPTFGCTAPGMAPSRSCQRLASVAKFSPKQTGARLRLPADDERDRTYRAAKHALSPALLDRLRSALPFNARQQCNLLVGWRVLWV